MKQACQGLPAKGDTPKGTDLFAPKGTDLFGLPNKSVPFGNPADACILLLLNYFIAQRRSQPKGQLQAWLH
jgi:hypothetical protein